MSAQQRPVVVELFTSQGCSSCPTADAYLRELSERDDVIALALHVDYWDYIGWKDIFAQPEWTERQRYYAKAAGQKMVYTPQMVINGEDLVVGSRVKDIEALIARHKADAPEITLSVTRDGDTLSVSAVPGEGVVGPFVVQMVRYMPEAQVDIERGENAGKSLHYVNIVEELEQIHDWDGRGPMAIDVPFTGEDPAVVLIQRAGHEAILAGARIEKPNQDD